MERYVVSWLFGIICVLPGRTRAYYLLHFYGLIRRASVVHAVRVRECRMERQAIRAPYATFHLFPTARKVSQRSDEVVRRANTQEPLLGYLRRCIGALEADGGTTLCCRGGETAASLDRQLESTQ